MGLTQGQVAEALDWSLSKVNRIEAGDVTVSSTDLRALLGLFGITDDARVHQLLEEAKASRRRGWWDEPKYREHLTQATMQMLQFETEASAIRAYNPTLLPGVVQTPKYSATVFDLLAEELPESDRPARLEARLRRREQVFDQPDPPQYFLILDESVLLRDIGGSEVMAEQLHELLTFARRPNVMMRILSLVDGAKMAMAGSFVIFDVGDEENAVLYRETALGDEIYHSWEKVKRLRDLFEQMWEQALSEDASARVIEARAAVLLSSLDMRRPSG
jgi:transcriptional regulator with XRE-family HTH domain